MRKWIAVALSSLALAGCNAAPEADGRVDRLAARIDDLRSAIEEMKALGLGKIGEVEDRLDGVDADLIAAKEAAHGRRKALADELRAERRKDVAEVRSAIEAQVVIRGQQVTAERSARRKEIAALFDRIAAAFAGQSAFNAGLLDRLKSADARIEALESRPAPQPPPAAAVAYEWRTIGGVDYYGYPDGDVFRYTHWRYLLSPDFRQPGAVRCR